MKLKEKSKTKKRMNILIIDDNPADTFYLEEILSRNKILLKIENIKTANSLKSAEQFIKESTFYDVILLDLHLPDSQGGPEKQWIGLKSLIQLSPQSAIIVITGSSSESLGPKAIRYGAQGFLLKGDIDKTSLLKVITYSVERNKLLIKVKRKENELIEFNKKLHKANSTKSEFLTKMSHEIRTPLNLIIGMADLLRDTPLSHQQTVYVDKFERAGSHLLTLINDILDISKIEAGQMNLQKEHFNMVHFVEDIIDFTSVHCHNKKLKLEYHIKGITNDMFLGDTVKIRQMILNLINNALKFTKKGKIALDFQILSSPILKKGIKTKPGKTKEKKASIRKKICHLYNPTFFHFSIQDTGPGISKSLTKTILQPFYQADSTATREIHGTGLGLSIVRGFVELMKGNLNIKSEEGNGLTFSFEIPIEKKQIQKTENIPLIPINFKKALICSDSQSEINYIKNTLSSQTKIECSILHSGKESEKELEQNRGENFDIVFLDLSMKDFGGMQIVNNLEDKKIQLDYKKFVFLVPCIHRKDDFSHIKEKTGSHFLIKPVKTKNIQSLIKSMNEKQTTKKEDKNDTTSKMDTEFKKLKILFAEDDPDNTFLFQAYFAQSKDNIQFVKNGQEALNAVKKNTYDFIFMDIQMPIMDGIKASHEIQKWHRETKAKKTPPICALTANALTEYRERIPKDLFLHYITKPVKKEKLIEVIERFRSKKKEKKIA